MRIYSYLTLSILFSLTLLSLVNAESLVENSTSDHSLVGALDSGNLKDGSLTRGQSFRIGISSTNVTYTPTKINMLVRNETAISGNILITVERANSTGFPNGTIVATGTFDANNGANGWVNFTLTPLDFFYPGKDYFFYISSFSGVTLTAYFNSTNMYSGGGGKRSNDGGVTWFLEDANQDQYFEVFGDATYIENNRTFNSTTLESSQESFLLNITSTVNLNSANLVYNGTNYTSTITPTGSDYIITNTISIPTSTGIKFFYWDLGFAGGVAINTSISNQTVSEIIFQACNSTFNTQVINFTTKSAENPFPSLNATFKSAWEYRIGSSSITKNYTFENLSEQTNDFRFCSNYNGSININADLEYDATGYAPNFYYIDNGNVSNVTTHIKLYLLNDSKATLTILKVRDSVQNPLENVTIQIQLYDIGTGAYYTVGMAKTSFAGQDLAYLNWYDSLYKFILIQEGTVIKSTDPYRISETPQIFDVTDLLTFGFEKFEDFEYSLYFNNATNNFVLTFTKPSGLVDQGCLRVIKRSLQNDTQLYLSCLSSSSGTLSYNIGSAGNGTFIATFYATGSISLIDWISEEIGTDFANDINSLLGKSDSLAYAFLLGGIIVALFAITPVLAIVGVILALMATSALGFTVIDYTTFAGIVIVGGVIIWLLKN